MIKRICLVAVLLAFISTSVFGWATWQRAGLLDFSEDDANVTIALPNNVGETSYLYVPTIESSTLAISGSMDGTTFGTVYDEQTNGATKIAWGVGATTGALMVELPPIQMFKSIKITCGTVQTADRTFVLLGK